MDSRDIYTAVSGHYSAVSTDPSQFSGAYSKSVAQSFGYTEEELAGIPSDSNLGLSCGNPLAIANLGEGETVIDLGSGAGFDVFLVSKKVGPTGRAIGVDMNKDMLALAGSNKSKHGADNVEFVEGRVTSIPLPSAIADVVISNCVVNLVPEEEKQLVFNEIFRLLKPGGRVAISDILAKKPLPEKIQKCAAAYAGCVAGASLVSQYQTYFLQAGFSDVLIKDANADLNVYINTLPDGTKRPKDVDSSTQPHDYCSQEKRASDCCVPASAEKRSCCSTSGEGTDGLNLGTLAAELAGIDLNEWVGSYKIFAVKPRDVSM